MIYLGLNHTSWLKFSAVLNLLMLVFFSLPKSVSAQDSNGMHLQNFESAVSILPESWLQIAEKVDVVFETSHHGIYRTLPYRYHDKSGNVRNIKIDQISVVDENNTPITFEKTSSSGKINLKIGDPARTLTGLKHYQISYKVWGAINYFDNEGEFYWNVTGNDWAMPIEKSGVSIKIPEEKCLKIAGFQGPLGSSESAVVESCGVVSSRALDDNENLTIAVRWPKELTPAPSAGQKISNFLLWNWIYFTPILTFIITLLVFLKYGRDPRGKGTIAPQFEPPRKMTPIELGALLDNKAQRRDFSAMIIDFAVKGFLTIKEISNKGVLSKTDYEFNKKKTPAGLADFEQTIFDGLFSAGDSVKLSGLKNKFYTTKKEAEKQLFSVLVNGGYYTSSPITAGAGNYILGGLMIFASFFIAGMLEAAGLSYSASISSLIISGLIIIAFGYFMPKRTKEGAIALEEILGFKLYLETAEKYRMKFYEKEKYFEKYLPHAMALGVAKIWASKFKNIYQEGNQPGWYSGGNFTTFNAIYFASAIGSNFSSNINSAFTSTPSSGGSSGFGGGGSSGGGFGGGGGGGW